MRPFDLLFHLFTKFTQPIYFASDIIKVKVRQYLKDYHPTHQYRLADG